MRAQAICLHYSNPLLINLCEAVTSINYSVPVPSMNVVLLRSPPAENRLPAVFDGRVARVAVFDDMAAVAPHWLALESAGALATPYQRHDFLALW